jgi:putative hydrolase of the HAD superfamily
MSSAGSGVQRASRPEAFLVDVYETLLTCDFERHRTELPAIAGAGPKAWGEAFTRIGPDLTTGRLSMAQGFGLMLKGCGIAARPGLVTELVRSDRELLSASARLHDDAIPFLRSLRSAGVRIALVSNCAENTRQLLAGLGVSDLADAVVLSCEVRCAKPGARIYEHALGLLGVRAGDAVFVDDQAAFCAGAVDVGMTALQIVRGGTARQDPARPGVTVIRSLAQATALL